MEPSYVIVSILAPADGEVIYVFARVDIIWQFVFCLSSEGQLMPVTAFNSRETFLVFEATSESKCCLALCW